MTMIADILMAAGAFGAAFWCWILSKRLKALQTLESGMGGAIAVLSVQVDDMTRALETAQEAATGQAGALEAITKRGEAVAARLEMMLAAMHDLPDPAPEASPVTFPGTETERRMRFVRRRARENDAQDGVPGAVEAAE